MNFIYRVSGMTIRYVDQATGKVKRISRYDLPVGHPLRVSCPPLRRRGRRRRLTAEEGALFIESQQK